MRKTLAGQAARLKAALERDAKLGAALEAAERKLKRLSAKPFKVDWALQLHPLRTEAARLARVMSRAQPQAPLPPGWKELVDPNGKVYYDDTNTHETSWDRPPPAPAAAAAAPPAAAAAPASRPSAAAARWPAAPIAARWAKPTSRR